MDQDLQQFIEFHKRNFAYDAFVIWDLNHRCIYASDLYLKYMQTTSLDHQELSNINQDLESFSLEFRDKITIPMLKQRKPYTCCYLLRRPGAANYGLHYANVYPISNQNDQLIAYCTRPFQMKNDLAIANFVKKISNTKHSTYLANPLPANLTERERIVLFLLVIGLSHKEIANTLSKILDEEVLSTSISLMISRQIYPKFDTRVNSELLIKAISGGFLYSIPHKLATHLPKIIFVSNLEEYYENWEDK